MSIYTSLSTRILPQVALLTATVATLAAAPLANITTATADPIFSQDDTAVVEAIAVQSKHRGSGRCSQLKACTNQA